MLPWLGPAHLASDETSAQIHPPSNHKPSSNPSASGCRHLQDAKQRTPTPTPNSQSKSRRASSPRFARSSKILSAASPSPAIDRRNKLLSTAPPKAASSKRNTIILRRSYTTATPGTLAPPSDLNGEQNLTLSSHLPKLYTSARRFHNPPPSPPPRPSTKKKGGGGIAAGSGVRVAGALSSSHYCRQGKEEGKTRDGVGAGAHQCWLLG